MLSPDYGGTWNGTSCNSVYCHGSGSPDWFNSMDLKCQDCHVLNGDNEIDLPEFNKWGEPLDEGIFRVISENLTNLLSTKPASVSRWEDARSVDFLVKIKVTRFDGNLGGNIILITDWSISVHKGKEIISAGRSEFIEPSEAADYEAFVMSQSRAILSSPPAERT